MEAYRDASIDREPGTLKPDDMRLWMSSRKAWIKHHAEARLEDLGRGEFPHLTEKKNFWPCRERPVKERLLLSPGELIGLRANLLLPSPVGGLWEFPEHPQKEDYNMDEKGKGKAKVMGKGKKGKTTVEFTFCAPEAKTVFLAGEFNHWDTQALPMNKDRDGIWRAKVELPSGRHEYKLFADNAWVEDIPDAERIPNPFGTQNFVIGIG